MKTVLTKTYHTRFLDKYDQRNRESKINTATFYARNTDVKFPEKNIYIYILNFIRFRKIAL